MSGSTATARQIMTTDPVTCHEWESVNDVAKKMWDRDVGALPVTNGDGRVLGVITDRDICMACYTQGKPMTDVAVSSAMSRTLHVVEADAPVDRAMLMMQEFQIRRLPVVDEGGRAVGMLSLNDLAQASTAKRKGPVTTADVSATLQAICQPRAVMASQYAAE